MFCQKSLRVCLSNYLNPRANDTLPVIDATMQNNRFDFEIRHTTALYDIKAEAMVDASTNSLVYLVPTDAETPGLDQHVVNQALKELRPHIELLCNNAKCKHRYSLSSYTLTSQRRNDVNAWTIGPVKLFLETFRSGKYIVQNDWIKGDTSIYLYDNDAVEPIKTPIIDFEEMGKDRLLNRIRTLVTFS